MKYTLLVILVIFQWLESNVLWLTKYKDNSIDLLLPNSCFQSSIYQYYWRVFYNRRILYKPKLTENFFSVNFCIESLAEHRLISPWHFMALVLHILFQPIEIISLPFSCIIFRCVFDPHSALCHRFTQSYTDKWIKIRTILFANFTNLFKTKRFIVQRRNTIWQNVWCDTLSWRSKSVHCFQIVSWKLWKASPLPQLWNANHCNGSVRSSW